MTSAEWHSTLFQFIGLLLSLATFIGSVVAIYYTYQNLKEMKNSLPNKKISILSKTEEILFFTYLRMT